MKMLVTSILALSTASAAFAQWSSDPMNANIVAGTPNDEGVPLAVAAPNGETWVSFAELNGGYKYSINRIDANGNNVFATPIVLSPNRTNTATFTYDMTIDPSGNAVVAFDDNGIYLQIVLPNGGKPLGSAGLLMPGSTGRFGPAVCALADGSYVVSWASNVSGTITDILNFQRVNANGTLGAAWSITETGRNLAPSDIVPAGSGNEFIAMWVRAEGNFLSRKGLKIQKWDSTNSQVWNGGVPVNVYTSQATPAKSIQNGYLPALVSDGSNGAIVAWYDSGAARNAWLQHVLADGSFVFAAEGAAASNISSGTQFRLSAAVAYHPSTQEYTVAYERSNINQSQFGLSAQRFSAEDGALWNSGAGIDLTPLGANHTAGINVAASPTGDAVVTYLAYSGSSGPHALNAIRLDNAGNQVWSPSPLTVSTDAGFKQRPALVKSTSGDWYVAGWTEGPTTTGSKNIYAMRINIDGTLGGPTGPVCDSIDFNNDTSLFDPQDIDAFLSVYGEGPCVPDTATCNDIDFNNDTSVFDPCDIDSFLTQFSEGPCTPCGV
ncbi:MAG: hypothetical protein U0640_15715 [Phycisphaerales bacterium]